MADAHSHIKQGEHNRNLAVKLGDGDYRDWTVTTAFYAALNFLEAGLLKKGKGEHTETLHERMRQELGAELREKSVHALRDRLVDTYFPKIRGKLGQLRHMSEAVRYLEKTGGKQGNEFITVKTAEKALADLGEIETETKKT